MMSEFRRFAAMFTALVIAIGGFAASADAQKTRNEREVRETVKKLNSQIDDFRYSFRFGLRDSDVDASASRDAENSLTTLTAKMKEFERNLTARRENADDVAEIVESAFGIDSFLENNRINDSVDRDWSEVRILIDRLAANYGVDPDWSARRVDRPRMNTPIPTSNTRSGGLTGTYQINTAKSENPAEIAASAGSMTDAQREDLTDKLEAAEQIAIDVRGNQIVLASSNSSPVSFTADGRTREEYANGKTIKVNAAIRGQELTVSSVGGQNDVTLVFLSVDGGRGLKVTRRITTDYLDQTIFAESFYDKTDSIARITNAPTNTVDPADDNGGYSSNDPDDLPNSNAPTTSRPRTGNFIVPNGTLVTGVLENDLTTKISQNNDRFRLTVQSPNEYRGAVIDGYISGIDRSGKVSGSSKITFNFEKITLRSGEVYEFAGNLQSVTDANGKVVKIDTEGTAKSDSQTKETVKRGGIGAGLGAIIGAIAGGGKGAIIGAVIGGGAGAGSVVLQGKEDLDLKKGSQITVTASSPNR